MGEFIQKGESHPLTRQIFGGGRGLKMLDMYSILKY